jgi:hypothetical protein
MKIHYTFMMIMTAAVITSSCSGQNDSRPFVTVLTVIGSVKTAGTADTRELKSGDKVFQGETVNTGEKSAVDIVSAGGEFLRIHEKTSVFFPELGDTTRLFMDRGKCFLVMGTSRKDGFILDTPFLVMTAHRGSGSIAVSDTSAKIDAAAGTFTARPVLSGIASPDPGHEVKAKQTLILETGEKTVTGKGELMPKDMPPADIDTLLKEAVDIGNTAVAKMEEPAKNMFQKEITQIQETLKGKSPILTAGKVLIQGTVTDPSEQAPPGQ